MRRRNMTHEHTDLNENEKQWTIIGWNGTMQKSEGKRAVSPHEAREGTGMCAVRSSMTAHLELEYTIYFQEKVMGPLQTQLHALIGRTNNDTPN